MMSIDDQHLGALFQFLRELPLSSTESETDFYRSQAIKWMLKRIQLIDTSSQRATSIQAFVGPHGSGKTTMIAKLAAQLAKNHRNKILLVSYDQNKLGGSDQLRVLAKLLNLSFEVIDSPQSLEAMLKKHHVATHVLIDTSGRNPKAQHLFSDLKGLAELPVPVEFHLVLSCSEKSLQIERSMRAFSQIGIASVHFSRLDESWSYGEIFNVTCRWGLGIGYFSIGDQVPEDLEKATKERIIERIFSL
jgi:flagellar biosynthesis protein FlhF